LDDDCLFPIYHTSGEVNHESCAVQFRVNPKWEQESFSFFSVSVLFCFVLLERRSFGRRGQDTFPLCLLIVWPRLVFENITFLSLSLSLSHIGIATPFLADLTALHHSRDIFDWAIIISGSSSLSLSLL
jgi:hypothetical protein